VVVGVADDLGYGYATPNAVQRAAQSFGSTRPGAWIFSKSLARADRLIDRLTGGRTSSPELLAGLPVLQVTMTGRKSGLPRTTPLIAVPLRDTLALLGTNFGQPHTPAWVYNLEADPHVRVSYRGVTRDLVVRPPSDEEAQEIWAASRTLYGGYEKYRERISGRAIRLFVLEAA